MLVNITRLSKKMIINAKKRGGGTLPALYLTISSNLDTGTGKHKFQMADSAIPSRMFRFGTCVATVGGVRLKGRGDGNGRGM